MAFRQACVWEVRDTGSDTNGGAYFPGDAFVTASGTDYSQQNAPQLAVADAVANGTSTVTSATGGFTAAMADNFVYLVGGTGSLAGTRRQITGVNSATSISLDAAVPAGTGVTLRLGGSLASPVAAAGAMAASNTAWVKAGSSPYLLATTLDLPPASDHNAKTVMSGYGSVRGDTTQATLRASSASMTIVTVNGGNIAIRRLAFDGNNLSSVRGVQNNGNETTVWRCKITNCTNGGIVSPNNRNSIYYTQVTGCSGVPCVSGFSRLVGCAIHHNTAAGVDLQGDTGIVEGCLVAFNSGSSSDGVIGLGCHQGGGLRRTTSAFNGRHGGVAGGSYRDGLSGNLFYGNGGFGLAGFGFSGVAAWDSVDYNGFGGNTSGSVQSMGTPGNSNANLTANPFTNSAGASASLSLEEIFACFAPNATAGGGALLRGVGYPAGTDIGAVQSAPAGGGGGGGSGYCSLQGVG